MGISLKHVTDSQINEALRGGMDEMNLPSSARKPAPHDVCQKIRAVEWYQSVNPSKIR